MSPAIKSQVEKLGFKVPTDKTPPPPAPSRAKAASNGLSGEEAAAIMTAISESPAGFIPFDKRFEKTAKTSAKDRALSAGYDLRVRLRAAGAIAATSDLKVRVEEPDANGTVRFWIGKS
jgi:hypothetical protein